MRLPPRSLTERLAAVAAANPDRQAIASMDAAVTHAAFQDLIRSVALHLRARGVDRHSCLSLVPEHPIIMLGLAMACSLLGCPWMAATPSTLEQGQARFTHVLHLGETPRGTACATIQVDASWRVAPSGIRADFPGYGSEHDPWMIARLSGTTGEPKLIPLTERMFLDRIDGGHHVPHPAKPALLCMFPLLSYANIINAVRTLAQGGTILYGDPAELFGKIRIDVLNGSPNQHATFMNGLDAAVLHAKGPWIGAARVTGATAGPAFYARLLRHAKQVVNVYSSTEAAVHCARIIDSQDLGTETPSVGRLAEGCVLEIVDAEDRPLPDGEEGIVRVRTPGMATTYLEDPELSAQVFRNGYFHPGDIGRIAGSGELLLTGRIQDLVNIGGVKRNPALIDDRLCTVEGVLDAACFALPSPQGVPMLAAALRLAPMVELARLMPHLKATIEAMPSAAATPRRLYVTAEIPRNANGKVLRQELPALVAGLPFVTIPATA